MTELKPLIALLEHVERERDEAAAAHRLAHQRLEGAERQAEQLHVYRGDYRDRYSLQSQGSGTPELLHCYHGFMDRLHDAIDQHAGQVDRLRAGVDASTLSLRQHELRVASVRKLIERRQAELRQRGHLQERRQNDEHAAHLARHRSRAGFSNTCI